jgi:lipopolysaccharide/colanic/teichoic acid biosynthesis glycosyltransferase
MSGRFIKRSFDLAVVILTAPIWLPLLVGVFLLVRWKLGAPVFFRQLRPGHEERIFELIKFRTMRGDRDALGALLPDGDRLPPFGRWLRSTSLDELPELWNVLKGEMSLVGPRPLMVQYLSRYSAEERKRHQVLPGLTGWAQIHGRNALSWSEKFALDVWYVENRTLALDARILFLTAWQVMIRRGVSASGEATMPEFNPELEVKGRIR